MSKEGDASIEDIYKQLTWLANNRLPELVAALYVPVSYTHLDVYKRQAYSSGKAG